MIATTHLADAPVTAAIAFLKRLHPNGPWALTAIAVDRKGIETRTFGPNTEAEARAWITHWNGKRNLYYSLNRPCRDLTSKAAVEDIAEVIALHVDLDPRAGEPLEAEQARLQRSVTTNRPDSVPAPTMVIASGGGIQVLWVLAEPITIADNADLLTRYNKQLELILGGDCCHDLCRILRLPGTENLPDAKKVAKGRQRATARVICDSGIAHSLDRFTPAPAEGVSETTGAVDWARAGRLAGVDDLAEFNVPERIRVVIVQGDHPDEPKLGDNSRSAWLFDVCCNLVRCRVPDEVIYSIITDPDFKISVSVLERGGRAKDYALRQIRRAHEEVEDPQLRAMNDRHCVVLDLGGQTRVITEKWDNVLKRRTLAIQRVKDFLDRYAHIPQIEDRKAVNRGRWWFQHPMRRQAESLVYLPGEDAPGDLNLWQGFAVTARAGTKHESLLAHIRDNLCSGKTELFIYLIAWLARAVQMPNKVGEVAIVLRGGRGTGKSFFAKHFGRLWGQHFLHVSDAKHLVGSSFNAHLRDCSILFADEAFWAGDERREGTLKALVTEDTLMIEKKGVDAQTARNVLHLIMASNEDWVVPAGAHERRFFVLDVGNAHQRDTSYFSSIAADLETGGYENFLHFLLQYDLTGFDVRAVPWTEALTDQVERRMGPAEELVLDALQTGRLPIWDSENKKGCVRIAAWDLVPGDMKNRDDLAARRLAKSIGWVLKGIANPDAAVRVDRQRRRWLPELRTARTRWKSKYGYEISGWPQAWVNPTMWAAPWAEKEDPPQGVVPFPENGGRNETDG